MLDWGRAKNGGRGRLRSGGGAGVVYWRTGGIDGRESLGGGLWEEDRRSLASGSSSDGGFRRNDLGSSICECAARTDIRSRLSTEREGIDPPGRRNGDCAGQVLGSRRGSGEGRTDFVGVDGCGMRCWRRSVEGARGARRTNRERVNRARTDDRTARTGSTEGRPLHGRADSGCELRAAVGRGGFLEGERGAWALKPCAVQPLRQFGRFAKRTRRQRRRF